MPGRMLNLREEKSALRERFKEIRRAIPPEIRRELDEKIAARLSLLWCYRECALLLCYVSGALEVGTRQLLEAAFAAGKQVAVPRCVPGTRQMEFYIIDSPDALAPGAYGIPEPQPDPAGLVTDFARSLCVVPALALDRFGYRLGFGKGYYDRFLSAYPGETLSICYESCLSKGLPHGKYDQKIPLIVTEKRILHP